MNGGKPCPELIQQQTCNTDPCPTTVELLSSKQVPQAVDNKLKAVAYPNPHSGTFVLQIESPVAGKSSIILYDLMGRAIVERSEQLRVGSNQVRFSNLIKMNYIYRVLIEGKQVSGKIFGLE
jgi:Secretion system C-terminal sorting domain